MMPLDLVLGVLDALGNLDLLLARQQRHLAHLLEIHPHRIVQDVQPALLLLLLRFRLLDPVHLGLVHDLDLQVAQLDIDLVQVLGQDGRVRQRVVDVVVGQVALLLGEPDQLLDLLRDINARLAVGRSLSRDARHPQAIFWGVPFGVGIGSLPRRLAVSAFRRQA